MYFETLEQRGEINDIKTPVLEDFRAEHPPSVMLCRRFLTVYNKFPCFVNLWTLSFFTKRCLPYPENDPLAQLTKALPSLT